MDDRPGSAREIALHIDLVVDIIASFLGSHVAHTSLRFVCRCWFAVCESALRYRSNRLLATVLPHRFLPGRIEEALFLGCGRRAGPGAYAERLKALVAAFRNNGELRARALSSALSPASLVRMAGSPRELQSHAAAAAQRQAEAALDLLAALPPPRPPDVGGLQRCPRCGCDRQWRTLILRAGVGDVNRASETLTCCTCRAEVPRDWGSVALLAAQRVRDGADGCGGSTSGEDAEPWVAESDSDGDTACLFLAARM